MNIALWVAAGILALVNLAAGLMKLLRPKEELEAQMKWVADWSPRSLHAIGILEVLGAIGILVPGIFGVATVLVPLAAVGLGLIQVGAVITNIRYGEANRLPINLILIALSAFVAWGRFGPYRF